MLGPLKLSTKSLNLSFDTHIVSLWCMIYPPDPKIHRKSTYAALWGGGGGGQKNGNFQLLAVPKVELTEKNNSLARHYWLWNFQGRDTKLERFLHQN